MNIRTITFEALGTAFFSQKYIVSKWYGYYQLDFSQAELEITHIWVSATFTGLISNLGGYSSVLTGFGAFLIGNYQAFIFDKSMLKKLYFQQRDQQGDHGEEDSGNGEHQEEEAKHDEDEMIERIDNRQIFTFGYLSYGVISFTSKFFCCCKKAMLRWPFYQKQWISF